MNEAMTADDLHARHEKEWQALNAKREPIRIQLIRPPRLDAQPELDKAPRRDN